MGLEHLKFTNTNSLYKYKKSIAYPWRKNHEEKKVNKEGYIIGLRFLLFHLKATFKGLFYG